MMMDAMGPVTVLSQFFQTENVDVALVKVKLDLCLSDLGKVKTMETPHLKELEEHLKPGLYKDHQLTLRPISSLSADQLDQYGSKELDRLCEHYAHEQTVHWKGDGGMESETTPPLIDEAATKSEWALLKNVVMAEQYPRDSTQCLWALINQYHGTEFPNLITLAQLSLILTIHTAGCERGFSVQNQTPTPSRNRLGVERQDMIMRVRLGPERSNFDFEAALKIWKDGKERRLYKLKTLQ